MALSLASAKDYSMQESARYLGAIPPLVELAASYNVSAAEVGRLALLSLRHRNERNAREILSVMRSRRCAYPCARLPWRSLASVAAAKLSGLATPGTDCARLQLTKEGEYVRRSRHALELILILQRAFSQKPTLCVSAQARLR